MILSNNKMKVMNNDDELFYNWIHREFENYILNPLAKYWKSLLNSLISTNSELMSDSQKQAQPKLSKKAIHNNFIDFLSEQKKHYDIGINYDYQKSTRNFNVSISLKNHSIADEIILITFYKDEIHLGIRPCVSINFEFDYCDIQLLQKILLDIFEMFFSGKPMQQELLSEIEEIRKKTHGLTRKSIDITTNAIKSIYDNEKAKNPQLEFSIQSHLSYTDIEINKRSFTIFHKDFMDNPKKIIEELHKLEEKCKNDSR